MKKLIFILPSFFSLITLTLFAQLNEGGLPKSLSLNLDKNVATYTLAPLDMDKINAEDKANENMGKLQRSGVVLPVHLSLNNTGQWTELENGDRIWRLVIHAKEAKAITLLYEDFKLPSGASLFLYQKDYSQIIGAFTEKNNHDSGQFTTELIYGDKTVLEYYEPVSQRGIGQFTISGVLHLYKKTPWQESLELGYDDSESCEVNINCSEGDDWQDEKKGVARIYVISGNQGGWCSGSLVNNTALDCTPYFLTAYHCGDGATTANFNNWIFYFNYEASGCTSPTYESSITSNANFFSVTGSSVVASSNNGGNSSSDFLLLELNNTISSSYDVYYNGWSNVNTPATSGVGIHHPAGDIKKISTFDNTLSTSGYNSSLSTHWKVYWSATSNGHGVTEGGSSGSPIFNDNGLIVGTLTGGLSYCSATNQYDLFGKMSYHWNSNGTATNRRVDVWLDPIGNGTATSLSGAYYPCSISTTDDAGISAIINPSSEICGNSFIPEVIIKNYGGANLTSCQIVYGLSSGVSQTYYWTGNLSYNTSETVSLPEISTSSVGSDIFSVYTEYPNGNIDEDNTNDASSLTLELGASWDLPLTQGFQSNSFPPLNYELYNSDNEYSWERTGNYGSASTASMYIDNWDYDAVGVYDWLILPTLNFSGVSIATLSYDYAYAYYDGQAGVAYDSLIIAYSTDCGDSWYALTYDGGPSLATAGGLSYEFTPSSSDWQNVEIDLNTPEFNNQNSVQFAFVAINGYGNNLHVDNINISTNAYTSVASLPWLTDLELYPNPTNDLINLEINLEKSQDIDITIFNTLGGLIQQVTLEDYNNGITSFDMSNAASGVYFIRVSNNVDAQILRFIKN